MTPNLSNASSQKKTLYPELTKIALGVLLLSILALSLGRDFDHDEFEAVHSSWKILNGEIIFVDFFQHHHPFFYYFIAPIIKLFGETTTTLVVLRIVMFSMLLGMLRITYLFADLFFHKYSISVLATLFVCAMTMFSQKAIEIRPDVPQVLFGLLSIFLLFKGTFQQHKNSLWISAVTLGVSFLFLQKTIFLAATVGVIQCVWLHQGKLTVRQFLTYWMLFLITLMPYLIFLISTAQFEIYLFWNWILNMNFVGSFSANRAVLDSLQYNFIIWIFYIIGIYKYRKTHLELVLISLLLLGSVYLVQAPYRQYFMPFIPLMCILSAGAVTHFTERQIRKPLIIVASSIALVVYVRSIIVYPNQPQFDKVNYVLAQTSTTDFVYDGDIYFNLYRKDIDFFWYSLEPDKGGLDTYQRIKTYDYDIYRSIDMFQPKVISTLFIDDLNHPVITQSYMPSNVYDDLYIRK